MVSLAGSAPARSRIARLFACSTVKRPEIWPEPPVIGDENARRRDHLVVEHDGERLADVLRGHVAEFLAAADIEAEIDDRLAAALVETGLRVGQILALHHHLFLDRDGAAFRLRQGFDIGGIGAGLGDETEFEFRRRAEDFLQLFRILQTRHLHENAVVALALDVRLGRAERVDAPAQDFDRLVDGAAHLVVHAEFRDRRLDDARRR